MRKRKKLNCYPLPVTPTYCFLHFRHVTTYVTFRLLHDKLSDMLKTTFVCVKRMESPNTER